MSWPTPQEYNEAIQHPALCFEDADLCAGVPDLTALGLPRPITGNFASVYRVRGARDWAVRCFFREFSDIGERYAAISTHLATARLPHTVGFLYLPRGIRVSSSWYPVLKMEWVEGSLLGDFVAAHRHDPEAMRDLAERWLDMLQRLEQRSIAHGDLQHGNVLVVGGELRLVDYDGMFVPALAGRTSHELGHPNYQHPGRTGREYFARLDHFSGWVVYLSLLALQHAPSLWDELRAGDECLLFRRADFENPQQSPALSRLRAEAGLRSIAEQVERILSVPPARVPPVEPLGRPRHGASRTPSAARSALPEWLEGVIPEPAPPRFAWPASLPRVLALLTACIALAAFLLASIPAAEGGAAAMIAVTAVLWLTYLSDPSVMQRVGIRTRVLSLQLGVWLLSLRIVIHERLLQLGDRRQVAAMARLARQRLAIREEHKRSLELISAVLRPRQEPVERHLAELEEGLRATEKMLLQEVQHRFVAARMRKTSLLTNQVAGLSVWTRISLWIGGVRAARNVSPDRLMALRRLTPGQAAALLRWSLRTEDNIQRHVPTALPSHVTRVVHGEYGRAIRRLERRRELSKRYRDRLRRGASLVRDVDLARTDRRISSLSRRHEAAARRRQEAMSNVQGRMEQLDTKAGVLLQQVEPLQDLTFRRYLFTVMGLRRLTRS